MIGRLRGKLVEYTRPVAIIDVGGVGYEVEVTVAAAAKLAAEPEQALVFTHFVVRDDAQTLFGFASAAEQTLFRSLIRISGVGPKLALALLSAVTPDQFAEAVAGGDIAAITRVPGIGKKTAGRLLMELRDKVEDLPAGEGEIPPGGNSAAQEAVLALVALGYRQSAATRVVADVLRGDANPGAVEEVIREALRRLVA